MGIVKLMVVFGVLVIGCVWCKENSTSSSDAGVYIVTLKQAPYVFTSGYYKVSRGKKVNEVFGVHGLNSGGGGANTLDNPSFSNITSKHHHYGSRIARVHDSLLRRVLKGEKYIKLYSYHYLVNGFAVLVTPQQAHKLSGRKEVANVVLDYSVRTATTHTPQFLGLPQGAWLQEGGYETAGEGVVIGLIDTGIDPTHVSFADGLSENSYPVPDHFTGVCEVTRDFPSGSCNRKLVGARHFAASAITRGIFNASQDYASPFDGDGHGTHTASIAAGNHGIPVIVAGHHFGNASGMAPRSHLAVYKALYKSFGGFAADVVAAIDQAAQDGVDVISLSITPNRRPPGIATYFNPIDMALLSAFKSGIFVVQAAGNTGPSPKSVSSFSPWIFTVGAAAHDRKYSNSIVLGNNVTVSGVGLAPGTDKGYTLVSATDALNDSEPPNDDYVNECQDASSLNQTVVQGNLLICSYSIKFVLGQSTINTAVQTARNLSAAGIVFSMDPFIIGFQLNPVPMSLPGIIISSANDSKDYNRFVLGPDPQDNSFQDADILKPNLVAPGNFIWAAWSSGGMDSVEFLALIKQKYPFFSPSAIGSALSTTASLHDKDGGPIMAQRAYANPDLNQSPATPFDMGSGFVNATAALDPGLILDIGYEDYMSFLCGINGSAPVVLNYTGANCGASMVNGADLNLPSITLAKLNQSRTIQRTLTNVGGNESYSVGWNSPYGVSMKCRKLWQNRIVW
nr:subtilisin-like protease SBT2.2 [Tanacetum cinerariifolium]